MLGMLSVHKPRKFGFSKWVGRVCLASTVWFGLHFFCSQVADYETETSLALSHRATLNLLDRDIDDLAQQLKPNLPNSESHDDPGELLFHLSDNKLFFTHSLAPEQNIEIENAKTSPFRASLGINPMNNFYVYDHARNRIDHKEAALEKPHGTVWNKVWNTWYKLNHWRKYHLFKKESHIRGTNLVLVSEASSMIGRFWVEILDCGIGFLLLFYLGVLALSERHHAFHSNLAREWLRQSLMGFRFGRVCDPPPLCQLDSQQALLISEFANAFAKAPPYPSGFSTCILNQKLRLATWSFFKAKLNTMLVDLSAHERMFIGRLKSRNTQALTHVAAAIAEGWNPASELIQCFYSDDTIIFACRTSIHHPVSSLALVPFRTLMKAGSLSPGNFNVEIQTFKGDSDFINCEAVLALLDLNRPFPDQISDPVGGVAMRTHLILREWDRKCEHDGRERKESERERSESERNEKKYEFNWVQMMNLEAYTVPTAQVLPANNMAGGFQVACQLVERYGIRRYDIRRSQNGSATFHS